MTHEEASSVIITRRLLEKADRADYIPAIATCGALLSPYLQEVAREAEGHCTTIVMLVSDFNVYINKEGNGAISFIENNKLKRVVIPKNNLIIMKIFDLYYGQLSSFKNRHYAIAKWIVEDIRRMGYIFKEKDLVDNVFIPVKAEDHFINGFSRKLSKEEKLKLLWLELDTISKKFELIQ